MKGLKIRLCRFGRKHLTFFRIGVSPADRSPNRKFALEFIGYYNPSTKEFSIEKDRLTYYLQNGATMSDTITSILKKNSII
jgi:ribosomal protein S16